jgi:hypothetical protein
MAILPSVLHGLATYAGFLDGLMTRLFERQMRRYGAPAQAPANARARLQAGRSQDRDKLSSGPQGLSR